MLLNICGVKYLMGLIIGHGLNHIVGNNWIFAGVPAHRQVVINWMNEGCGVCWKEESSF